jgi:hypothetical protein
MIDANTLKSAIKEINVQLMEQTKRNAALETEMQQLRT